MHLLRLSISKDALAPREKVETSGIAGIDDAMPAERSTTDAIRTAASYELQRWRTFEHEGKDCRAIAASPKGESKRGLNLHVHVQVRDQASVQYSTLVARITAKSAHGAPETCYEEGAQQFPELYRSLDAVALADKGKEHVYDNDVRRIFHALMENHDAFALWPGVSLVLSDEGMAYARALERLLAPLLTTGSLSLSLIALDMSQANREALARELGEELRAQCDKLTERCNYTAPNTASITKEYEALTARIAQAEALLGVEIPCMDAQCDLEMALVALA